MSKDYTQTNSQNTYEKIPNPGNPRFSEEVHNRGQLGR